MPLLAELRAIRERVALERSDRVRVLTLRGEGAREALLRLLPSRLHLRDGQVRESLLLDEAGRPIADVLVCADDEDYLLLVDGLDREALLEHVLAHLPSRLAPAVHERSTELEVVSLHGPWAWELVAAVLDDDMLALPYLNFFRIEGGWCVRAGNTGEYGYDVVLPRDAIDGLLESVRRSGEAWGLSAVETNAVDLCRFENGFFDPRHVPPNVTPLELQLQWRLDTARAWVGREAIDARREAGITRRRTCLTAGDTMRVGDAVHLRGDEVGVLTQVAHSPACGHWIASALIDVRWAHSGIDAFEVRGASTLQARSVALPLVDNRSIQVDPRRHSYREADEVAFRPLACVVSHKGAGP